MRLLIMSSSTFRLYEGSARLRSRWLFCQAEIPDVLTYRPPLASWMLRPSPLIFSAPSARAGRAFSLAHWLRPAVRQRLPVGFRLSTVFAIHLGIRTAPGFGTVGA